MGTPENRFLFGLKLPYAVALQKKKSMTLIRLEYLLVIL